MKEGELLYFSEEEFALLMELAGGNDYTLFLSMPELDNQRLTAAMISLFHRGLLSRTGDELVLSKESAYFHEIRNAAHVLLLRGSIAEERTLLCYVCPPEKIWLAELCSGKPADRYRLSLRQSGRMLRWLFDVDILPRPRLRDADAEELRLLLEEDNDWIPNEDPAVKIIKSSCGGRTLREYALYSGTVWRLLQTGEDGVSEARLYTREALNELAQQCFGG